MAYHILELGKLKFFVSVESQLTDPYVWYHARLRVDVFVFLKELVDRFWDKFISDLNMVIPILSIKILSIGSISRLLNKESVCARYGENVIIRSIFFCKRNYELR